jgi:hypothetical protein
MVAPVSGFKIAKVVVGKLSEANAPRAPPMIVKIVNAAKIPFRLTPLPKV